MTNNNQNKEKILTSISGIKFVMTKNKKKRSEDKVSLSDFT